jgi:hypothetical protein
MTDADIVLEYRQIGARDWEKENGKPYSDQAVEEEMVIDPEYEAWQRSIGLNNSG